MNCEFIRKLPAPKELKERYPVPDESRLLKTRRDEEIKAVISGRSEKLLLIMGPCSADNTDAVLNYLTRLRKVQERVKDKLIIIPRVYTNKPRTAGDGYMGMLHNPDPTLPADVLRGLEMSRILHLKVITETGFTNADEMLYPELFRYFDDVLSYAAVGARSVENQQHRLAASAVSVPVGMKNPTSGDVSAMFNAIAAAQHSHTFIYGGWEIKSGGNAYAHGILRGGSDVNGKSLPNYKYDDLLQICERYNERGLKNPALIIDANHSNSGKDYLEQINICMDVIESRKRDKGLRKMIKGMMVESYIEDGAQLPGGTTFGMSITDPCLGWEKSESLIYEIADNV